MNLMYLFAILMVFLSSPISALDPSGRLENTRTSIDFPVPDFIFVIELNAQKMKDVQEAKNTDSNGHTGFTPGKKSQRSFCLDSPLKEMTAISAKLEPVHKMRKLNDEEPISISSNFKTIFSEDYLFNSGKWAYADPSAPSSSVGIDCDDACWDELIDDAVEDELINCENKESLIASTIHLIHEKSSHLRNKLFCSSAGKLWCRHFATLALPIFTKLLNHGAVPFEGQIHQISADIFDCNWKKYRDGHVWNVLTINDGDTITHWLVDVFNKTFINLSKEKALSKLVKCDVNGKKVFKRLLVNRDMFWDYARVTKEKFDINNINKKSIAKDIEARDLAVNKIIKGIKIPNSVAKIKIKGN